MLRFKVDENLPREVAEILIGAGHDAVTVPQQNMGGMTDIVVADVCCQESRALVTLDMDFADIRSYPPADYPGIIVLRLVRTDKPALNAAIQRLLPVLEQEALAGKLWIVEEARIRIRG